MGLSVIPTNIAGVSINGVLGPLSSLFNKGSVQSLVYPADLASNPSMGHAVQFSIYEYKTGFSDNTLVKAATGVAGDVATAGVNSLNKATDANTLNEAKSKVFSEGEAMAKNVSAKIGDISVSGIVPAAAQALQAKTYQQTQKGAPLATISLFMPETLQANYNSTYSDISMTEQMGMRGRIGNAYGDLITNNPNNATSVGVNPMASLYGTALASQMLGQLTGAGGEIAQQAAGIFTNPQTQLLYKGIGLRTFTLEFILTPKSSQEAQTVKNICDTFTFYSLPGIAGSQVGGTGQYLTPPQIFSIKFKFLGKQGLLGSLTNVFNSALSNIGLGFITDTFLDPTKRITSGNDAKIMTINDCVLESVSVDYAPNGWAAYNDGYPVQTRLMLNFKETQMLTKEYYKEGSSIVKNYRNSQYMGTAIDKEVASLGGSREDFMTGSNGFGNYGE